MDRTLKDTGDVAPDPAELHAAIGAVEAELPRPSSAGRPLAAVPKPPATSDSPSSPRRCRNGWRGTGELQWADERMAAAGGGEERRRGHRFAPVGAAPAAGGARRRGAGAAGRRHVGDITLSADLYAVLVDEAQAHLATLERACRCCNPIRTAAVGRDGAREPYAVRHSPHGRPAAHRVAGESARAVPARVAADDAGRMPADALPC